MKKILSVILVILCLFTAGISAFAEEAAADSDKNVEIIAIDENNCGEYFEVKHQFQWKTDRSGIPTLSRIDLVVIPKEIIRDRVLPEASSVSMDISFQLDPFNLWIDSANQSASYTGQSGMLNHKQTVSTVFDDQVDAETGCVLLRFSVWETHRYPTSYFAQHIRFEGASGQLALKNNWN